MRQIQALQEEVTELLLAELDREAVGIRKTLERAPRENETLFNRDSLVDVSLQETERGGRVLENRDIRAMVKRIHPSTG
jgi:hypothetical protein